MCMDMCTDMCIDMCIDMRTDISIDTDVVQQPRAYRVGSRGSAVQTSQRPSYVGEMIPPHLCVDMCVYMRTDVCVDVCTDYRG